MVEGRVLHFHLAGINNQNFIMQDDETHTWWQQVSGEAIRGPLRGKKLEPVAWDEVQFSTWKRENPDGFVLLGIEKHHGDYEPADWETRILRRPTVTPMDDSDPLKPRDLVVGVRLQSISKAFPMERLNNLNLVSDLIGTTPLLLVVDSDGKSVRAFSRDCRGKALDLYLKANSDPLLLVDSQTGSEWNFSGKAIRGPLSGEQLASVQTLKDFWFDWKLYNPDTKIYRAE
jgi:hypothetical protein